MRSILNTLGSLWLAAVLLVLLAVAMACATVFESQHGSEQALGLFYRSWWFRSLLGLLFVSVACSLGARIPFPRSATGSFITHASTLVILLGALVTQQIGLDGMVILTEGETTQSLSNRERDTLTIMDPQADAEAHINLDDSAFHQFVAADDPAVDPLVLGSVHATVSRYIPDSERNPLIVAVEDPAQPPGIEVVLSGNAGGGPSWVFTQHTAPVGNLTVALRRVDSEEELARLLKPQNAAQTHSLGSIKVTHDGQTLNIEIENFMDGPAPLGLAGLTAHVLRYLPHATVGEGNRLTNVSNQPINPAIEITISDDSKSETRICFANFPGFSHAGRIFDDLDIVFTAADNNAPAAPIEVLQTPSGRLVARFSPPHSPIVSRELTVGEPVPTPWPETELTVLRHFQHAGMEWQLEEITPPREKPQAALVVELTDGSATTEVHIQKYQPKRVMLGDHTYQLLYNAETLPLGFSIRLDRFQMPMYPGGQRPRSFESHITIIDPTDGRQLNRIISMNHPTTYRGYTFYQSSYNKMGDQMVSYLTVSRDSGRMIVFAGYIGLMIGMILVIATRLKAHRLASAAASNPARKIASNARGMATVLLLGVLMAMPPHARADEPASPGLDTLRAIPTQHDGRWPPLDTVARDTVESVTGDMYFHDRDPVWMLLNWTMDPATWQHRPLIAIGNRELRKALELPQDKSLFSYDELSKHHPLMAVVDKARSAGPDHKPDPLEAKAGQIFEKLIVLRDAFTGQTLHLIPDATELGAPWAPIGQVSSANPPEAGSAAEAWLAVQTALLADDAAGLNTAATQLSQRLASLPAAHRPASELIATELRFNRIQPFRMAWMTMVGATALAALGLFVRRRWFDVLTALGLLAGLAILTWGLWLRWQIAGRIPASNMYESLLFLSWGMGPFAVILVLMLRHRVVLLLAAAMGAIPLALSDLLPLDHFIRPVVPVLLDTIWMSVHVPIIMFSYWVLAVAALVAHAQLVVMAVLPRRAEPTGTLDQLHYWCIAVGSVLLVAGIITGSMWGASSWGRYWGWDPKEVWSLVAFLAYMAILHVRADKSRVPGWMYGVAAVLGLGIAVLIVPHMAPYTTLTLAGLVGAGLVALVFVLTRGPLATALKSVLAFWLIIMTYVGVNYILGTGLHSYGFGTGAIVFWLFLIGSFDLALIAGCCLLYLGRRAADKMPA